MINLLFVVGPHGVGKTYTVNQYIQKNPNILFFDSGPTIRKLHQKLAPDKSMGEWILMLEKEFGKDASTLILAKELKKIIEIERVKENIIILGFRQIEGIEFILKYFEPAKYKIIYLDGTFELLKSNYENRENKIMTNSEFQEILDSEQRWGLQKVKKLVLNNTEKYAYVKKEKNDEPLNNYLDNFFVL